MKHLLRLIQVKGSVILNKIILGNTRTNLLDKTSRKIAFNKELSNQLYNKIDDNSEFTIIDSNKAFKIRLINPKHNVKIY